MEHVKFHKRIYYIVGSVFLVTDKQSQVEYALKQIRVNESDLCKYLLYKFI